MNGGYAQLRCGLSALHWQRLVQLAWCSSVTHLSCLTFLRDYFKAHKLTQLWRIPGMIALNVMLTVGLLPTAHCPWEYAYLITGTEAALQRPQTYDYAACFWNYHEIPGDRFQFETIKQRTIVMGVFLGLGMFNRLFRLYQIPVIAVLRVRKSSSETAMEALQTLLAWADSQGDGGPWRMYLL